jgi:hypothetical protein
MAPVIIGAGQAGLELEPQGDLSRALRPPTGVHLLEGILLFICSKSTIKFTNHFESSTEFHFTSFN